MNMDKDTQNVLLVVAVIFVVWYLLKDRREGYERAVIGGEYGQVQNEIFWWPYPEMEYPGTRHAKYDPVDRVHSVSYVYPDFDTTVNEPHGCMQMKCPPAFTDEDVKCYSCPQMKYYDSGR